MFLHVRSLLVVAMVILGLTRTSLVFAGEVRVPIGAYSTGITLSMPVKSVKELRENGITLQRLDYSCGSAALSTICTSYLQKPASEQAIIDYIVSTGDLNKIMVRKGFSLLDLKRFALHNGIDAAGYALDFDSLLDLHCPVLVPLLRRERNIDMRHFVVFRGADDERVFLADPAVGRRTIMRTEFLEEWNPKVGMVFSQPDSLTPRRNDLALGPSDAMYLTKERLRAIIMATVVQSIHQASEF